jgi:acyl-CoA synthetase (AMP-forming)/AMP-acid ligase II
MRTFLDKLEKLAESQPNQLAIVCAGKSISFKEFWNNIELVTTNAYRLGYQAGDTFIFASKPTPESIPLAVGLVRAGLRVAFVDPFTALNSFQVRVGLLDPLLVIAESTLYTIGSAKTPLLRKLLKITIADFGSIAGTDFYYTGKKLPYLPKGAKRASQEFLRPVSAFEKTNRVENSDSILVFTSGTTAAPKAVVHSLESISANFDATAKIFDFRAGDRFLCHPITVGLVALSEGATWVIPDKKQNTDFNKFFGVPTDALELMATIERKGVPKNQIEYFGMGGAPVPPKLVNRVLEVVGDQTRIPCIYGMTEILPVAHCDGREKLEKAKGDFLGKPVSGVNVRLASDLELEVSGSGLMKGYLGVLPNQWHPTGDLANLDENGNIVMIGRKKNMMIRGDMNIYPSLYEPGICAIVGVADAVMVGVPNEYADDQIVLFIVPESGLKDLERLRSSIWAELPVYVDKAALPDFVFLLPAIPIAGRSKKRDMEKLVELASQEVAEAK